MESSKEAEVSNPCAIIPQKSSKSQYEELFGLTEAELETQTEKNIAAQYALGVLSIEGTSQKVAKNKTKGVNYLREAAKAGHIDSKEYLAFYDIKFEKVPNLKRITSYLEDVVRENKSTRALNTLAEIYAMQTKQEHSQETAFKYYQESANQGCLLGIHWTGKNLVSVTVCLGSFYHMGKGVEKNIAKAIEYLKRSAKMGNCLSDYELFGIYSKEEGFVDEVQAYLHLRRSCERGTSAFQELQNYFNENYQKLASTFLKKRGQSEKDIQSEEEIKNLHEAEVTDLGTKFSVSAY